MILLIHQLFDPIDYSSLNDYLYIQRFYQAHFKKENTEGIAYQNKDVFEILVKLYLCYSQSPKNLKSSILMNCTKVSKAARNLSYS